eukprot:scaffold47028_cov87-Phaeocystis_antarctica.AAC.1
MSQRISMAGVCCGGGDSGWGHPDDHAHARMVFFAAPFSAAALISAALISAASSAEEFITCEGECGGDASGSAGPPVLVDQDDFGRAHLLRQLHRVVDRVCGLERREDGLELDQRLEARARVGVAHLDEVHAPRVLEHRQLGAGTRVAQVGRDRALVTDLARAVLQQVRTGTVQHTGRAAAQRCRGGRLAVAAALDAHELDGRVAKEGRESSNGRGIDARHHGARQLADLVEALLPRLDSDDGLEVANDRRHRVRPRRARRHVVRRAHARHEVTQALVDGDGERALDRDHLRAERAHQPHGLPVPRRVR